MKILIVEPGKHPRVADIPNTLESMHDVVGGHIEAAYPWDDPVALICDEDGIGKGYPYNRYINPHLSILGTFFICGLGKEDFSDLTDELIEKYRLLLYDPQMLIKTARGLIAIPVIDENCARKKN